MNKPELQTKPAPSKQDKRADATKVRICSAVVEVLDRQGYAETSINKVQQIAGVSRGALTHHFPTKQDLVCETAMRLLNEAMAPLTERLNVGTMPPRRPVDQILKRTWDNTLNTRQGRAFLEIAVACRTDDQLHALLQDKLIEWEDKSADAISQLYSGSGPEHDDAVLLWRICRSFLRGLLIHRQFVDDPAYLTRMIERFADIMKLHLLPRGDL